MFSVERPYLPDIFALHGKWRGNKQAVVFGDQKMSWQQLMAASHQLGHGLIAQGLNKGDRVALLMCNSLEMLQTILGVISAGGVVVPLNVSINDSAISPMISNAGAKVVVCSAEHAHRVSASSVNLAICAGAASEGWLDFESIKFEQPTVQPLVDIHDDDLINIIYSSGTTDQPKGICHSHAGRRDWAYDIAIALRYNGGARTLITIGMYSNITWVALLSTLLAGGTVVLHDQFNIDHVWRTMAQERISHSAMVPVQYQRLLLSPQAADFDPRHLVSLMSCGAPLPEAVKRQAARVFNATMIELYGLTEGIITTLEPEELENHIRSVGKPLIGTDIIILNDDDQPAAQGEAGEIASLGRISMSGYFNRPDATEAACWQAPDGHRWLRSGDIGYIDADGYLYIVDRKKDMILSGGQNIFPQDIEAVLYEHDDIAEAAVIAAKSQQWGETPIALVVLKPDNSAQDAADIKLWANQKLGKQQRITDLLLLENLPRNANGKLLKRELKQQYQHLEY